MSIQKAIEENTIILTEAAVIEKLRRYEAISLHPRLENATLIYDVDGKRALREIYSGYIDIACEAGLPINISTPTWRANRERVLEAVIGNINRDAVRFLNDLRNEWDEFSSADLSAAKMTVINRQRASRRTKHILSILGR